LTDIHERVSGVIEAFARGELIIVTDDDDRENEGDLFVAASLCTPEKMAFIALAFTNAVSALAEETWHHPELVLGFGFCEVSLTTRKIGGLHESDFVMAARIDALASGTLDSAWLPPLPPPKNTKR
jgi:hypothetical protein